MKITKKKYLILILYVAFILVMYLASSTLARYTSRTDIKGTFNIGQKLYFKYERGELFRNNNLIIGAFIEEEIKDETGEVIGVEKRVETMNVNPGDNLTYHFYISNYDEDTLEKNGIDGSFYISAVTEFAMPVTSTNYKLKCNLAYRQIPETGEPGPFKNFESDREMDLPIYSETDPTKRIKYEFQVYVILDDQIKTTSADDYIGATLSIILFIDATNDVTVG